MYRLFWITKVHYIKLNLFLIRTLRFVVFISIQEKQNLVILVRF